MRRRRFRKQGVSISLFPFLAVLICTMGALIALLVLIVQQASVQAESITQQRQQDREAARTQRQHQREDSQFDLEILHQQRTEMAKKLANHRLELSHLEDHLRRLHEQWKQLLEQKKLLDNDQSKRPDQIAAEKNTQRLRKEIEAAKLELQKAKEKAAQQSRSFSIVPYKGPNGTSRRPIFIECTNGRVILQPEGVELTSEDFRKPLIPGNPLDAALLATREYLARHGGLNEHGEPYPLMVVRPDGAYAYSAARDAMKSWDDEFGYELLDADMKLEFPPADEKLAEVLRQTIQDARRRQQILASTVANRSRGNGRLGGKPGADGFIPDAAPEFSGGLGPEHDGIDVPPGQGSTDTGPRGNSNRTSSGNPPPLTPSSSNNPAANGGPGGTASLGSTKPSAASPLSKSRGKGWANPNAAAGSVAFTRPIRIICSANRLVIAPQPNSQQRPQIIELEGPLRDEIDEFVSATWKHVKGWGIAGARAYWKPVLRVEVLRGGEQRFDELLELMQDSGMQVERRAR